MRRFREVFMDGVYNVLLPTIYIGVVSLYVHWVATYAPSPFSIVSGIIGAILGVAIASVIWVLITEVRK